MKKLMIAAATAAIGAGVYAKTPDAQVYDVNLTVKTTTCKEVKYTKKIAAMEGEAWEDVKGEKVSVRKQTSVKIAGVIWGCDCETIANPLWRTYNDRRPDGLEKTIGGYLFWYVGAEDPFYIGTTDFSWAVLNRIDDGAKAEGVWMLANRDAGSTVALLGAGFGKVKGTDCGTVLSSMSGNFAGFLLAPQGDGGCKFCGTSDCDGWEFCECTSAYYDTELTAAYGTWKIKFNSSASKKLKKEGFLSKSYKFKKAGNTLDLLKNIEKAAWDGLLATDDEDWDDEDEESYGEDHGEEVDPGAVATAAYGEDAAEPEEYEGENALVLALLGLEYGDAS